MGDDVRPGPLYMSTVWLAYTIFGLSITVIGGPLLGAAVSGSGPSIGDFADGGQFAVYTSSMLIGALYVANKPSPLRLPYTEWFGLAAYLGVFLAGIIMVLGTLVARGFEVNGEPVDHDVYRWPSVGLFAVSLSVASISVFLDHRRLRDIDLQKKRGSDLKDLARKVRKARG